MNMIKALAVAGLAVLLSIGAALAQDANGQTDMGGAKAHDAPSSSPPAQGR